MFWPVKRNDLNCLQGTDLEEMQSLCKEELTWKAKLKFKETLALNFSTVHWQFGFDEKSTLHKCF